MTAVVHLIVVCCAFQYRSKKNFIDPAYLGPRIGDKIVFSFLIATLYWDIGNDFSAENHYSIASLLFMWCTLPAFGAASYVPSIVLGNAHSLFLLDLIVVLSGRESAVLPGKE